MDKKKNIFTRVFGRIGRFIKKHKILMIILLLIIIGICVFFAMRGNRKPQNMQMNESKVQTTTLKKRDLSTSVSVTGTIASADSRSVTTNLTEAEVTEVSVSVGDYVKKGDTIVVFDTDDAEDNLETAQSDYELNSLKQNQTLENAKDSVEEAQENYDKGVEEQSSLVSNALSEYNNAQTKEADALSEYENAQEKTKQAKKTYENLKDKKKSLKKAMDNAQKENQEKQKALNAAKETYEKAEAEVKYANENDDNYETLYSAYTTAYDAYTKAQKEAESADKAYEKAKEEYDSVEKAKTAYETAKDDEEKAKTAYEEACTNTSNKSSDYDKAVETQSETNEKNAEKIEDSKESLTITSKEVSNNLKNQKEQLQEAEEKLGKCVVTSPIDGYITSINVEAGDTYNGSDALFVVQDMSQFVVDATVDEYDIASLAKDQEAVIKTDATGDEELKGVLTYVALTPESSNSGSSMGGSSSSSSSNYAIQITLTDTSDKLRVGMTAKTSIVLESAKDVFAVAYDCIEEDKEGNSYITVLDEEKITASEENKNATKKINVTVGMESDYYVEISGDELEEGLRVVTPETVGTSSSSDDTESGFEMGGFPGGDMSGGMPSGGPSGGNGSQNRGGGGAPGGF